MMQTDVKGATCPNGATTTAYNGRTRLRGLMINIGTAAATVAVGDGANTLFTYTGSTVGAANMLIPGEGVLVQTSLTITCAGGATAVAFYG